MISVGISVGMSSCQLAIRGAEPLHGLDISTNQMYNVFAILGLKTCINAFRVYRYDSKPHSLTQTLHNLSPFSLYPTCVETFSPSLLRRYCLWCKVRLSVHFIYLENPDTNRVQPRAAPLLT